MANPNQGLQFEWCIYHLAAVGLRLRGDADAVKAATQYKMASAQLKKDAKTAVKCIETYGGAITKITKMSGGVEPKTDLLIRCARKTLKCSLKYGGAFQLSSAGIGSSVAFLSGVIANVAKQPGYDAKKAKEILEMLGEIDALYGGIGSMPKQLAEKKLGVGERYNAALKTLIGTSKAPTVTGAYGKFKLAIIHEAMTGQMTFKQTPNKIADHVVSEKEIVPISAALVQKVADKTSVRIGLKGRGHGTYRGKEVRMNEIVIRFDTRS